MLGDNHETGVDVTNRRFDGGKALKRVRRLNMPGSKVNEPYRWLARIHRQQTEVAVVCDHDAALRHGPGEHARVRLAAKAQLDRGDDVFAQAAKLRGHLRVNVLVSQQWIRERHAGIFTSQTTSFFIPLAAYATAARTASAESCG